MSFQDLTDVERIAMDAWSRGSADSTQCLIAVRAAVREVERRYEQSEDAQLTILRKEIDDLRRRAVAVAEEYERAARPIASTAVAGMLREWVGVGR